MFESDQEKDERRVEELSENEEKVVQVVRKVEQKKKGIIKIVIALFVGVLIGLLLFNGRGGFVGEKIESGNDGTVSIETVKEIIKPASELVTGKYFYTNAVSSADPISIGNLDLPGTTDKYVYTYDGTISAGYDLSKAKLKVDNDNKVITINMPKMEIFASEVDDDSFEYVFQHNSVFNPNEEQNNAERREKCDKKMRKKAMTDKNFAKMTKENAEAVIRSFLTTSGDTKKYKVKFVY